MIRHLPPTALLLCTNLSAFSPQFHEMQTRMARGLIPKDMAAFMKPFEADLLRGVRSWDPNRLPSVEEVEKQFQRIIQLSEEKKKSAVLVFELGLLARMAQTLLDPSVDIVEGGGKPSQESQVGAMLRNLFQAYGDEMIPKLVLTREPYWAVTSPLNPRPQLDKWKEDKKERNQRLLAFINPQTGAAKGAWDTLSIPFAQLQLSFSNGVHASANLWILAYRAAGELWEIPQVLPPAPPQTPQLQPSRSALEKHQPDRNLVRAHPAAKQRATSHFPG